MKLRDPLAMPAIRGICSGSQANHEEIDCQGEKTDIKGRENVRVQAVPLWFEEQAAELV